MFQIKTTYNLEIRRSQWPRGLRCRSAAAWLLRSRVRIPLSIWMFVSCVYMLCCPVWVEASVTGWSLVQRSPTVCLYVWSGNLKEEAKDRFRPQNHWMDNLELHITEIRIIPSQRKHPLNFKVIVNNNTTEEIERCYYTWDMRCLIKMSN
jgi:hypothetical protein